jgi:multiple sugar transport system permease protein
VNLRWGSARDYAFLAPLVLLTALFVLVPVIGTIVNSFFMDVPYLPRAWVGLGAYRRICSDPGFAQSLRFTIGFTAAAVTAEIALGLAMALLLDRALPWRGLLRACVLIPWAIPSAVAARTWELIYNYSYGLANAMLRCCGLGATPVNWLGSPASAFTALLVADTWKTSPFVAIILLAGLAAIPEDVYRQAQVDGASAWKRFTRVTLPLLKPVLVVAVLFRTIDTLRIFDLPYVLTKGGPGGATTPLSLHAYRYFLAGDFGYGAAVSVVLFAVAFGLSVFYVRLAGFTGEAA